MNESTSVPLLIIDDDRELGDMLAEYLSPEGYEVSIARTGEDGLKTLASNGYQLVILDIMMPGMSGMEVLQSIRRDSDLPVIMLTAKGDDVDRILGLEFGADDYLSKPFNPRELLARIKAILRRSAIKADDGVRIRAGALELDPLSQRTSVNGHELRLTGTEFELLRCLAESPGRPVTKETLSERALGRRYMPYDRSIDTHMSKLRSKLADAGSTQTSIQSRRGVGYSLLVDE